MNEVFFGYSTTPNIEVARKIAEQVISKKLAACVNILPQMESIYTWKGQIEHEQECVLIFKTTKEKAIKLEETLLEIHPYECPCVVFLPVASGYSGFLKWIDEQLQP